MDAVETDLLCGGLSLADAGDGFSSFLNWADDVLDGIERNPCAFAEGDVLVQASTDCAPGSQWRPALDTPEHSDYPAGQSDVPEVSAKTSRRENFELYEAPTSSDSGGNAVEMTHDNGRRSARRRTPTSIWPEENIGPAKRLRREKDDQDYIVPMSRRTLAPSSPTISPAHEAEDDADQLRRKGTLQKASSQRSESKRSPVGSPAKSEVVFESASAREDEEEDWKPPSDRASERPRPAQRKPAPEAPEGQPVVRAGGVFKTAALNVLRAERRLLSTGEITRVALKLGFLGQLPGKTPEATMASALYTDIKKGKGRNGAGSIFCRPAEGSFGLREWYNDPELAHILDPTSRGPTPRSQRTASGSTRRGGGGATPTLGQQAEPAHTHVYAANPNPAGLPPPPPGVSAAAAAAFLASSAPPYKGVVGAGPAPAAGRVIPCAVKQGPVAAAAC